MKKNGSINKEQSQKIKKSTKLDAEIKMQQRADFFSCKDGFLTKIRKVNKQNPFNHKNERILEQIILRNHFLKSIFSNDENLKKYVEEHKETKRVQKRIQQLIKMKIFDLEHILKGKEEIKKSLSRNISSFRALVVNNSVEVGQIFPEIPKIPSVCELWELTQWYMAQKSKAKYGKTEKEVTKEIFNIWVSKIKFFNNRWQNLTNIPLVLFESEINDWDSLIKFLKIFLIRLSNIRLSELEQLKAPVPLKPYWNKDLYSREARRMRQKSALEMELELQTSQSEESAVQDNVVVAETGEEIVAETDEEVVTCEIDDLYELAGARTLRQPEADDPRYTFPGTLYRGEDIFYDYSLIIPVEECGPCGYEVEGIILRRLFGAKILVGKANTVISFLKEQNLSQVFGVYKIGGLTIKVADDIQALLDEVLRLNSDSLSTIDDPIKIRDLKRRLKEMGGLMRIVSRSEMYILEVGGLNPKDFLEALSNAIDQFPHFDLVSRQMPTPSENGWVSPTLRFPLTNYETKFDGVEVPDAAYTGGIADEDWKWRYSDDAHPNELEQRGRLRHYVRYLGDEFYGKLDVLKKAAKDMRTAVRSFEGGSDQSIRAFERLASGLINSAARSLSYLFDEIAEQLTIPKSHNIEGSKRLALQVIFRQFWYPEAYIQGKLVGHKNILPGSKEVLKRRTFLKTSREMTTVEEFATERQNEYSHSQKETAEFTKEVAGDFNLTQNASGSFDFAIGKASISTEMKTSLSYASKAVKNIVSEAIYKGSVKYNDKREVKIRELSEYEDVKEFTSELKNENQEITANYFYFQLLRQYMVTINLQDIRPVLLRKRDVPSPAEIDHNFVSTYIHILIHILPTQLAVDAQEVAGKIEILGKKYIIQKGGFEQRQVEFNLFQSSNPPPTEDSTEFSRWQETSRSKERLLAEARKAWIEADKEYFEAMTRMNRVLSHLRENITYYMQFIWHTSPKVDQDVLLDDEYFCGEKLPSVTRGLIRQGYFGSEEIFDYTGRSLALFELILENLTSGSEIASLPEDELLNTTLFQYLERYYPEEREIIINQIRNSVFVTDPVDPDEALSSRRVQIAQDALVVEAMPGQVPLLEGYQMANRILYVQKTCLENRHLAARISDKPWKKKGDDIYNITRNEGNSSEE